MQIELPELRFNLCRDGFIYSNVVVAFVEERKSVAFLEERKSMIGNLHQDVCIHFRVFI